MTDPADARRLAEEALALAEKIVAFDRSSNPIGWPSPAERTLARALLSALDEIEALREKAAALDALSALFCEPATTVEIHRWPDRRSGPAFLIIWTDPQGLARRGAGPTLAAALAAAKEAK